MFETGIWGCTSDVLAWGFSQQTISWKNNPKETTLIEHGVWHSCFNRNVVRYFWLAFSLLASVFCLWNCCLRRGNEWRNLPKVSVLINCLGLAVIVLQLLEYTPSILLSYLPGVCQHSRHRVPATASVIEFSGRFVLQFTISRSCGPRRGTYGELDWTASPSINGRLLVPTVLQ